MPCGSGSMCAATSQAKGGEGVALEAPKKGEAH